MTAPRAGPAVVTPKRKPAIPADTKKAEPAPAVVRKAKPGNDNRPDPAPLPTDGKRSAIVTVKRKGRFGDVPDMTPEELQRRGDAADAFWRADPADVGKARLLSHSDHRTNRRLQLAAPASWRCGMLLLVAILPSRRQHCPFIKTRGRMF